MWNLIAVLHLALNAKRIPEQRGKISTQKNVIEIISSGIILLTMNKVIFAEQSFEFFFAARY
jgi:hypothetical protein